MALKKTLTAESLAEFKQAFDVLDKGGKGHLDANDLEKMMETLGQKPSEEDLSYLMNIFGIENSQRIDFHEFLVSMATKFINPSNEDVATSQTQNETLVDMDAAFKELGANSDNVITAEKLGKVMADLVENLKEEDIKDMIMVANTSQDKNGTVSLEEFKKIVKPVTPRMKKEEGEA